MELESKRCKLCLIEEHRRFPKFFHFSYILLFDGLLIMKLSLLGKSLLFPQDAVTSLFLEGHFGIHLEVASDSFCFLINSSWLLVFILYVFFMIFSGFNLFCWKWIHFSYNNFIIFGFLQIGLIFSLHFWLSSFFCLFLSFISFFLKVS